MSRRRTFGLNNQTLGELSLAPTYWGESLASSDAVGLKLYDPEGNLLVPYANEYAKLSQTAKRLFGKTSLRELSTDEIRILLTEQPVRLIKYLNPDALAKTELAAIIDGEHVLDINGSPLPREMPDGSLSQNCVIAIDNKIYIHPKVRAKAGSLTDTPISTEAKEGEPAEAAILGVNHSSLSHGRSVQFAGSLVYYPDSPTSPAGWYLENTTGHYKTRQHQLTTALKIMHDSGIDISKLYVKRWIPKDLRTCPPDGNRYDTLTEKATDFLARSTLKSSRLFSAAEASADTTAATGFST